MKGLLIEFDARTGIRAGNIDPRDATMRCLCQNLETTPAKEIRLIEDDRDMNQYRNIPGITVLDSPAEINACVDAEMESQYGVSCEALFATALARLPDSEIQKFAGKSLPEILCECYKMKVPGIYERKPQKLTL